MVVKTKLLRLPSIPVVIATLLLTMSDAQALLNGTDVTGSLVSISLPTTNLFDVGGSNALGCGNFSDNTVVIGAGTEFCFLFSIFSGVVVRFTDSANFTDNTLTLVWAVGPTSGGESFGSFAKTYEFTNAAFAGLSITEQNDSFINGGMNCNLTSITLSCNWAGSEPIPSAPYTHEAVYIFTAGAAAVPEPSSLALLAFGLAAIRMACGRRHS